MKIESLRNYCRLYHAGNKASMARELETTPQYVTQMLASVKPYHIVIHRDKLQVIQINKEIKL